MVAVPLASIVDVEQRWRALGDEAEATKVQRMLEDVSAFIRRRFPSLDARITAGTLTADEVAGVVARVVIRSLSIPRGIRQEATGAESVTYDTAAGAGDFYLAPDEAEMLAVTSSGTPSQIQLGTPYRPYMPGGYGQTYGERARIGWHGEF